MGVWGGAGGEGSHMCVCGREVRQARVDGQIGWQKQAVWRSHFAKYRAAYCPQAARPAAAARHSLRGLGVLAAVGHGQHAPPAVLQPAVQLVLQRGGGPVCVSGGGGGGPTEMCRDLDMHMWRGEDTWCGRQGLLILAASKLLFSKP